MATSFPTSLDSFTNPGATDALNNPAVLHHSQHANLNDAVAALEAKVGINGSADTNSLDYKINHPTSLPSGVILMWSGSIASIPSGWTLCDGTLGTPDLRDKFVVGASVDSGGIAKTNIEGSLKQTGGVTGHSHSAHANLTHAGLTIGDHTGLTHGLSIANHPDLTHNAINAHAASTFTHADHSVPSQSHTHASGADVSVASGAIAAAANLSMPSGSIASHAIGSAPSGSVTIASGTHTHAASTITGSVTNTATGSKASAGTAMNMLSPSNSAGVTVTNASFSGTHASQTGSIASAANLSMPSLSFASHAAGSAPSGSVASSLGSRPSITGSDAATTLTHNDHSFPSLSHNAISDHKGTDYGVHTFTAPAAHGVAGTLSHSFSEPNDHTISPHDTVGTVPNYWALAYIQKT